MEKKDVSKHDDDEDVVYVMDDVSSTNHGLRTLNDVLQEQEDAQNMIVANNEVPSLNVLEQRGIHTLLYLLLYLLLSYPLFLPWPCRCGGFWS